MSSRCILAIDQGTTNTKAVVVDEGGIVVAAASERVEVDFPQPGWAESDPMSIWESVKSAVDGCLSQISDPKITSIGISNQRESVVAWERSTGDPLGPMVSWRCSRGRFICDRLDTPETRSMVAAHTGLALQPMFSASKMRWLLDSIPTAVPALRRVRSASARSTLG